MRIPRIGLACLMFLAATASGQARDTHVPKDLEDWRGWVLHGEEYRRCPFLYDSGASRRTDFICAWPGPLELSVAADGGRFQQTWNVYGEAQWVPLPGEAAVWPGEVASGRRDVEVVLRDGVPMIRLAPGRHQVTGVFSWDTLPTSLPVPKQTGLLTLTVDGQVIRLPRRTEQGVWLGVGERAEAVEDKLTVNVYRRIEDQVPTRLETIFELEVTGTVREESITPALPTGFVPLSLASELPARVTPVGSLQVQVRPGSWRIGLNARGPGVLEDIAAPQPEDDLWTEEVWGYQTVPRLRATVAEAARAVDPARVNSPWRGLPTFLVRPGESLVVAERTRGLAGAANSLQLDRRLWLDFDGRGFAFADTVTGTMRTGWRLDMAPPYDLLAASEGDRASVVTVKDDSVGIELRETEVNLDAQGRVEVRGEIPVTGWQAGFESARATLNVPPGHRLLAALGVDAAPSSWVGRWRLLDFFLVLIITAAAARLFGRVAGAVALLALVVSFHEPGAPLWTWLNLLAAAALARVAPAGRLRAVARGYRLTSFVVLLLFLVPFGLGQIRIAIYPQLEPETHRLEHARSWGLFEMLAGRSSPAERREAADTAQDIGDVVFDSTYQLGVTPYSRHREDALRQTGPGKPDWEWITYSLHFSGPVDDARTMRLVILPEWLVSALRFLMVLALAGFAAWFAFDIRGRPFKLPGSPGRGAGSAAATGLFLCLLTAGDRAWADPPSPAILDELKARLLPVPACAPRCAEVVGADVEANEEDVTIRLSVHAMETVALPLPGTLEGWQPAQVEAGKSALPAWRDGEGVLWVRLEAGRHELILQGPIPPGDTLEIPFAVPPRSVAARSEHWFIAGVENRALKAGALNLTRLREESDAGTVARWEPSRLPAFLEVERSVVLGLDWTVFTIVTRRAPETGAINVEVPLLDGEAVIEEGASVVGGSVAVAMDPTQQRFYWRSTLPRQSMTLRAPTDRPWQEVWKFNIGSDWHVDFAGIPESMGDEAGGRRVAVFHPRQGEELEATVARPDAAPGGALAFDRVSVQTSLGAHRRDSEMRLEYRSTRGASHRIRLPEDADVTSVSVDGKPEPVVALDGETTLPILPGEHTIEVAWNQPAEPGFRVRTPSIELAAPASNIASELHIPTNRWLLFTAGPTLGAAVLYWPQLVALVLASLVLGRLRWTPLRAYHWLLLGLGFSMSSWFAFAVVVAWLFAHGTRKSWGAGLSDVPHRLVQIGFGALTLAAFAAIIAGIGWGLLGNPDMQITGFDSGGSQLRWFADRAADVLPGASVWSVPVWTYKVLILAWALWLSFALVRWLPWVWQRFAERGLWYLQKEPADS